MLKHDLRIAYAISILSFIAGGLVGFHIYLTGTSPETVLGELGELIQFFKPYKFSTVLFVYFKNLLAVLLIWLLGFIFIIPCIISLGFNGYLIGYTITYLSVNFSFSFAMAGILPHGVFELPALILAGSAGILGGISTLRKILSILGRGEWSFKYSVKMSFRLIKYSVVLLIPAAIIEVYLTPIILEFFR